MLGHVSQLPNLGPARWPARLIPACTALVLVYFNTIRFTNAAPPQFIRIEAKAPSAPERSPYLRIIGTQRGAFLVSKGTITYWDHRSGNTWTKSIKKFLCSTKDSTGSAQSISVFLDSYRTITSIDLDGKIIATIPLDRTISAFGVAGKYSLRAYGNEIEIASRDDTHRITGTGRVTLSNSKCARLRHTLLELWSLTPFELRTQIEVPDTAFSLQISEDGTRVLLFGLKSTSLVYTENDRFDHAAKVLCTIKKNNLFTTCAGAFIRREKEWITVLLDNDTAHVFDGYQAHTMYSFPDNVTPVSVGPLGAKGLLAVSTQTGNIHVYACPLPSSQQPTLP